MSLKSAEQRVIDHSATRIVPASWSLTTLLAVLTTLAAGGILLSALSILYWSLDTHLHGSMNGFLADELRELQEVMSEDAHHTKPHLREEVAEEVTSHWSTPYYIRLLRPSGEVVLETPGMPEALSIDAFPSPNEIEHLARSHTTQRLPEGDTYRLLTVFVDSPLDKQNRWHFQVALDISAHRRIMDKHGLQLGALLIAGLIVSSGVGALVAYICLRPLRAITSAAQRITSQRLDERIAPSKWPRELMVVARAFDTMLDQLEDAFARLSQFAADLAHELRRPLQNLKGEAESALTHPVPVESYRRVLGSSLEEYDYMAGIIDDLLFLARAENPRHEIAREYMDGQDVLQAVQSYFEASAEEQDIEIFCQGQARLYADPTLAQRALSNLLSNALRYTPRGGTITLAIQEIKDAATEIRVQDTGSGIAPEHLPHVFDRFYRIAPESVSAQHHSGIGLALVKSIMTAHNGEAAIESTPGVGTVVRLVFPRRDDAD